MKWNFVIFYWMRVATHIFLINILDSVLQRQLDFIEEAHLNLRRASYRRKTRKLTSAYAWVFSKFL